MRNKMAMCTRTVTVPTLAALLLAILPLASWTPAEEAKPARTFGPQGPQVISP